MGKILCYVFGHPDIGHLHNQEDTVFCNEGCEKEQVVYYTKGCHRCGKGDQYQVSSKSDFEIIKWGYNKENEQE